MSRKEPVAVLGLGAVCAAGRGLGACLDSLFAARRNCRLPRGFPGEFASRFPAFQVDGPLPGDGRPRTRTLGLARLAAAEALAHAGLDATALAGRRVGVCLGSSVGGALNFMDFYAGWRTGRDPALDQFEAWAHSNPAAALSRDLGLSGPCQTVANACTSGADAIGVAASWVREGVCDLALAGGADELHYLTYVGFIRLMVTHDAPCRPFDRTRKGLNLGEGAGVLVLASAEAARSMPGPVRGHILGYGAAGDNHHPTAPAPDGRGLRRAVSDALAEAGAGAGDLAFVNAHGTGTVLNDAVEARVLHELAPGAPLSATKGGTGHTLGAAGALEACFTLACLERGEIPPSAGFAEPDPDLPAYPFAERRAVQGGCALSTSLAFGGLNAALVLGAGEGV